MDVGLRVDASFSDTRNESGQSINGGNAPEGTFRLKQKKIIQWVLLPVLQKQFGKKVSLNASLSLQYYKASVDSAGKKKTLWNRGRPFPSIEFYLQGGSVRYADVFPFQ